MASRPNMVSRFLGDSTHSSFPHLAAENVNAEYNYDVSKHMEKVQADAAAAASAPKNVSDPSAKGAIVATGAGVNHTRNADGSHNLKFTTGESTQEVVVRKVDWTSKFNSPEGIVKFCEFTGAQPHVEKERQLFESFASKVVEAAKNAESRAAAASGANGVRGANGTGARGASGTGVRGANGANGANGAYARGVNTRGNARGNVGLSHTGDSIEGASSSSITTSAAGTTAGTTAGTSSTAGTAGTYGTAGNYGASSTYGTAGTTGNYGASSTYGTAGTAGNYGGASSTYGTGTAGTAGNYGASSTYGTAGTAGTTGNYGASSTYGTAGSYNSAKSSSYGSTGSTSYGSAGSNKSYVTPPSSRPSSAGAYTPHAYTASSGRRPTGGNVRPVDNTVIRKPSTTAPVRRNEFTPAPRSTTAYNRGASASTYSGGSGSTARSGSASAYNPYSNASSSAYTSDTSPSTYNGPSVHNGARAGNPYGAPAYNPYAARAGNPRGASTARYNGSTTTTSANRGSTYKPPLRDASAYRGADGTRTYARPGFHRTAAQLYDEEEHDNEDYEHMLNTDSGVDTIKEKGRAVKEKGAAAVGAAKEKGAAAVGVAKEKGSAAVGVAKEKGSAAVSAAKAGVKNAAGKVRKSGGATAAPEPVGSELSARWADDLMFADDYNVKHGRTVVSSSSVNILGHDEFCDNCGDAIGNDAADLELTGQCCDMCGDAIDA